MGENNKFLLTFECQVVNVVKVLEGGKYSILQPSQWTDLSKNQLFVLFDEEQDNCVALKCQYKTIY